MKPGPLVSDWLCLWLWDWLPTFACGLNPQCDDFLRHRDRRFRRFAIGHRPGKVWYIDNPCLIWLAPIQVHSVFIQGASPF